MRHLRRIDGPSVSWELVSVRSVLSEALSPLRVRMTDRRIVAEVDVPASLQVQADRSSLREALRTLLESTIDELAAGGQVTITALENANATVIEVADDGVGLIQRDGDRQDHEDVLCLHPTRLSRNGAMHRVQQILRQHAGELEVMDCPDGGTAFTLSLPKRPLRAAA